MELIHFESLTILSHTILYEEGRLSGFDVYFQSNKRTIPIKMQSNTPSKKSNSLIKVSLIHLYIKPFAISSINSYLGNQG